MKRALYPIVVFVLGLSVGYFVQADEAETSDSIDTIKTLEEKRISILQERVVRMKQFFGVKLIDKLELVEAQMDLIRAQLEYAESDEEKKELLSKLLELYDQQIEIAETNTHSPLHPRSKMNSQRDAVSHLLLLKSERIGVQIELKKLK